MVINAIKTLCNLPRLYQTATIEDKRYLVETIFNGMLIYDKDVVSNRKYRHDYSDNLSEKQRVTRA